MKSTINSGLLIREMTDIIARLEIVLELCLLEPVSDTVKDQIKRVLEYKDNVE